MRKLKLVSFLVTLQSSDVEALTPSTSECDYLWRESLYGDNKVKMRLIRWALIQIRCVHSSCAEMELFP